MGLRRLRGRLDQMQGHANLTLADVRELVADLQDGFSVTLVLDGGRLRDLIRDIAAGRRDGKVVLPLSITIDPDADAG